MMFTERLVPTPDISVHQVYLYVEITVSPGGYKDSLGISQNIEREKICKNYQVWAVIIVENLFH